MLLVLLIEYLCIPNYSCFSLDKWVGGNGERSLLRPEAAQRMQCLSHPPALLEFWKPSLWNSIFVIPRRTRVLEKHSCCFFSHPHSFCCASPRRVWFCLLRRCQKEDVCVRGCLSNEKCVHFVAELSALYLWMLAVRRDIFFHMQGMVWGGRSKLVHLSSSNTGFLYGK